jgi:hypothetical protein
MAMMLVGGAVVLLGAALLIGYSAMVIVAFGEVCLPSADPQHTDIPERRNAELGTAAFSRVAVAQEVPERTRSPGP